MTGLQQAENHVGEDLLRMWRRDIVKLSPVIKINSENILDIQHPSPAKFLNTLYVFMV